MADHRQNHEIQAWLGDDFTPEQTQRITADFRTWETDNPHATEHETGLFLQALAMHHDNSLNIDALAGDDLRARLEAQEARDKLKAASRVRTHLKLASERQAAREARVDRVTMHKWLTPAPKPVDAGNAPF